MTAAKIFLYNTMLSSGIRKADLARRLNIAPTLADRLLNHRHASRIEQLEPALAVFGKSLAIELKESV